MNVELIDSMGGDLSVVNAARVSFGKMKKKLDKKDEKLIAYLAKHKHWTPFGHCSLQFHIKAPVFVARQLVKHQVGLVWNEISRRYVDSEPEYYEPEKWRSRVKDKKQGSDPGSDVQNIFTQEYPHLIERINHLYTQMISHDICPEQARMILPQSMITEWYWSGSLMAFARVCNLRCKPDAQLETKEIADQIDQLSKQIAPISWNKLRHFENEN